MSKNSKNDINKKATTKPKAETTAKKKTDAVSKNEKTLDEKKLLSDSKSTLSGFFKKKESQADADSSVKSQKVMSDSNKTMIVPKADTGKIIYDGDKDEKPSLIERVFPEKYFTYEEKPKNFGLAIAVTSVRMFVVFAFIGMIAGMGALLGVASAYVETSPAVNAAVLTDLSKTSLIFDANGKEITKYTGVENRVWVKLEEMPENLKNAFVSIEDTRFYSHEGIDYKRLFGAFVGNLQSSSVQGGSTISQQLVKIRMLTSERSYKRKIQEAYMTMNLEKNYSKNQILESYMNTILLGGSNYGVEAAANDYFDKNVKDLTLRECAMLAGITQSPNKFNPRSNFYVKNTPEVINDRTNLVLQSMYSGGRISHDELLAALEEEPEIKRTSSFKSDKLQYSYFVDYAIDDIINNLITQRGLENTQSERNKIENELRTNGYRIHLTIDSNIQNIVQTTLSEWNRYPKTRKAADAYVTETIGNDKVTTVQPEAAAVVYDYKNGEYKAIVGGRNLPTAEKILNRASKNASGVGSSIKPITVYGPALDMGMSPSSMISNEATSIPGWQGGKGYPASGGPSGMVTLRSALVSSMNRATARLLMTKVGVNTAADYLLKMGVDPSHVSEEKGYRTGSGLALGTAPITPIEMATSFGTIANSGVYMKPITFSKVENSNGEVILDGKAIQESSRTQVYKESTAYMLTDMLEEAVSRGTGTAARIKGMATAGKTGTNENKNVSFSGYTPYYSATLFIGHDKFKDLSNVFAGTYAAPLWKSFMTKIHEGLPNKKIIDGTGIDLGITNVSICAVSGLRATDACSHDIQGNTPGTNMVAKDSAPSETCNVHQLVTICNESHKAANEACPNKIDIAVLNATGKVNANMAGTYLAVLKEKYPELDSGKKCTIHKVTTTSATTETTTEATTTKKPASSSTTQNTSSSRTEAASTLGSAKKIIDNKNNGYSADKLAKLKNAYNNLSSYYKRSDATDAGIRQRITNLKKYM